MHRVLHPPNLHQNMFPTVVSEDNLGGGFEAGKTAVAVRVGGEDYLGGSGRPQINVGEAKTADGIAAFR
jgi:hypothetical protein